MTQSLLSRLESLSRTATSEDERLSVRAQWAGAMARLGQIDAARAEIAHLRQANKSYSPRPTTWILLAEGLADHFESLSIDALDKFKRAYAIGQAIGDIELWTFAAAWMSAGEFLVGAYAQAVAHAVEAINRAPASGSVTLSRAHLVLANVLYTVGSIEEAGAQYAEARRHAVEAHDISMQSAVLYNVAAFRIARISLEDSLGDPVAIDDVRAAELELNSIANLDIGLGVNSLNAMVPITRAQLLLVQQQWEAANLFYSQAIPEAATYGQLRWEPRFLAEQSHAKAMLGEGDRALQLVREALQALSARVDHDDAAACHGRASLALAAIGMHDEAASHARLAREHEAKFSAWRQEQNAGVAPLLLALQ